MNFDWLFIRILLLWLNVVLLFSTCEILRMSEDLVVKFVNRRVMKELFPF